MLDLKDDIESSNRIKSLMNNRNKLNKYSGNSINSVQKYNIQITHRNNLNFIDKIYNN